MFFNGKKELIKTIWIISLSWSSTLYYVNVLYFVHVLFVNVEYDSCTAGRTLKLSDTRHVVTYD